jgi:tRNA (mo5U34)-methyltransferase
VTPAERAALIAAVAAVPVWWHSIPLAPGIITPGWKTPAQHDAEWAPLGLDDLTGQTVLDVGTWDGAYAFRAEAAGAARVVAMDRWTEPGAAGFRLAHAALTSLVEPRRLDLMTGDLTMLGGPFDVVLALGVLYHQADPWGALTRLAGLTRGQLLIETEAVVIPGANPALPLWALRDTLPTCWWIPTLAGLTEALRGVGLSRVTVRTPLPIVSPQESGARHYRLTVQGRA